MDYQSIIDKYYPSENELRRILLVHSRQVADRCLKIAKQHPELRLDIEFLEEVAMLHDIGIFRCNAPSIECVGTEPYICHGVLGRAMLDEIGLFRHALVCERHTGAGLARQEIIDRDLPLPHRDLLPLSIEEKIVCYADKFYSKSHPERVRTLDVARGKLEKYGLDTLKRFDEMAALFGEPNYSALNGDLQS